MEFALGMLIGNVMGFVLFWLKGAQTRATQRRRAQFRQAVENEVNRRLELSSGWGSCGCHSTWDEHEDFMLRMTTPVGQVK